MIRLDHLTSPEAEQLPTATLLVPLGSTEQHGPHLPLNTDSLIAEAWANGLAEAVASAQAVGLATTGTGEVAVAPLLPYGASGEHQHFAGTLSVGTAALHLLLVELIRSAADRFSRVVFVSGHAGNAEALSAVRTQMLAEGHEVDVLVPVLPGGDAHAGRTETSLLLHLRPDLVRLDRAAAGRTDPIGDLMEAMRGGGVIAVSPNGVLGDPAGANADEGAQIFAELVALGIRQLRL